MKNNLPVKFANKFFNDMADREAKLAEVPGAICPNDDSPVGPVGPVGPVFPVGPVTAVCPIGLK